jgi:hypothetical protein
MHCNEYNFRFPCCLCADGGGRGVYVESAIYPWWNERTKKTDWTAQGHVANATVDILHAMDIHLSRDARDILFPSSRRCSVPCQNHLILQVPL